MSRPDGKRRVIDWLSVELVRSRDMSTLAYESRQANDHYLELKYLRKAEAARMAAGYHRLYQNTCRPSRQS